MTENKMQNLTPTEAKVYDAICEILTGDFEIPAEKLRWDGLLYEDYDIDSIDAVDMIGTQEVGAFGRRSHSPAKRRPMRR